MQIWSIYPDGSERTQITRHGGFYAQESFDRRFLYYTQSHTDLTILRRVPISGGDEIDVATNVLDRNFAVTSRGVYFATAPLSAPKLEFLSFAESKRSLLALFPKSICYGFGVSPNERELMYGQKDTIGADLELVNGIH